MSPTERRVEKFSRVLASRRPDLTVVLENIHDPHNVSAILRSCDAVGVMQVELLYTQEKFPRIGKKSSSSASKWIARRRHTSIASCYETLKAEGFTICATHLGRQAHVLYDLDLTGRIAFVVGNEHRGVSDEAAALADMNFQIPMTGMIQSLNVSVASAVCLFEAFRQRRSRDPHPDPALSSEARAALLKEWLER